MIDTFNLPMLERSLRHTAWMPPLLLNQFQQAVVPGKIYVFDEVTSTNTVVWDLLHQGATAGTVAIARQQQAGRGQRGHHWISAPGGLYLSWSLAPDLPVAQAAQLTLGSAWGIATALRYHGVPVGIKWLNDLVVNGYKLGGILTETRIAHDRIQRAVIGVGINWQNPVPETGINLQSVFAARASSPGGLDYSDSVQLPASTAAPDETMPPIDSLEALAAIVLQGLQVGYGYGQQMGGENLASAYEALLVNRGTSLTVNGQAGTIVGITTTGQLRVAVEQPIPREICLEPGSVTLGYTTERLEAKG
jgi:BirA family transcriptional regulator, biotin operon repressor / biotin---[acetyl-CoA-carboxylase] ligase